MNCPGCERYSARWRPYKGEPVRCGHPCRYCGMTNRPCKCYWEDNGPSETQVSNVMYPSYSINTVQMTMPRNGVMTHHHNDVINGVHSYTVEVKRNGVTVDYDNYYIFSGNPQGFRKYY